MGTHEVDRRQMECLCAHADGVSVCTCYSCVTAHAAVARYVYGSLLIYWWVSLQVCFAYLVGTHTVESKQIEILCAHAAVARLIDVN